jgi:hypothetical protein
MHVNVFHSALPQCLAKDIERIMRIYPDLTYSDALINDGISTLENRREYLSCKHFDIVSNDDHKLAKLLPSKAANRDLRKEPSKSQYQIQTALRTVLLSIMRKNTINNTLSENL